MAPGRRVVVTGLGQVSAAGTDLDAFWRWVTAADPAPDHLRVVTFNVEEGKDVLAIAAAIRENPELSRGDVFLLQEEEDHPGEGGARAARLAQALGLDFVYVPARVKGDGTHGLAILSVYPLEDVEEMRLPYNRTGRQRIAVRAQVVVGGERLQLVDVHLETLLNVTDHLVQLRPAVIDLPDAALVAGDFNSNRFISVDDKLPILPNTAIADTEQAPIMDEFMHNLGFDTPAADVGDTERMYGVSSRLDAIYTRGLTVTPARVERGVDVSDHWPVWLDVGWPPAQKR